MRRQQRQNPQQLRQLIAQTAARILVEDKLNNLNKARQKAAARIGSNDKRQWPDNKEIEQAIIEYQALFLEKDHFSELQHKRRTALNAMQFFKTCSPRLVGAVLRGTAGSEHTIHLHLFCNQTEEIVCLLQNHNIPYQTAERLIHYSKDEQVYYPCFIFLADEQQIELCVFPANAIRRHPHDHVDGGSMPRASMKEVSRLLDDDHE